MAIVFFHEVYNLIQDLSIKRLRCVQHEFRLLHTLTFRIVAVDAITKLPCARDPNSRDRDVQPRDQDETLVGLEIRHPRPRPRPWC
jgi:hypothetical protein